MKGTYLINLIDIIKFRREVSIEYAKRLKESLDLQLFMETSAKTGSNIKNIFNEAGRILYDDYYKYQTESSRASTSLKIKPLDDTADSKKGKCCGCCNKCKRCAC